MMDEEELINTFRENGYKVTVQRLAICKCVLKREDHPSAEEIHQALKLEHPTISLGTIYKTLHLMRDLGLIQELGFKDGTVRYDPDTDLHVNLVCTGCGKIYDYKPPNIEGVWKELLSSLQIQPEGQRIDVYHKCPDRS